MNSSTPSANASTQNIRLAKLESSRYFYTIASVLLLIMTVIGFKLFYFQGQSHPGRPIPPPIRGLIIAHGIGMSAWLILMIVQPLLIATRYYRLHMVLGKIGAVFAGVILILGFILATKSTLVTPADETFGGLTTRQFMAVPYTSMLMFGVYVGIGIYKRKRSAIHKPIMFLATLSMIPAAMDRIDAVRNLYIDTVFHVIWGPFFSTLVIGLLLFITRCFLAKSFDRVMAIGLGGLFLVFGVMMQVATTPAWDWFASLVLD